METLIDRYLSAVSDALPVKQRTDTVTEIKSLIQDALDDRSKAEGRPPDDEMMTAVLKQFGPPEKIVAPYLPERYLIGPRLFPTFLLVLRIVLPIVAVAVLAAYWLGAIQLSTMTIGQFFTELAKSMGGAFSAVIQAFADIVIIFAILQWVNPEFSGMAKETEWDPHSLKAISQPDRIKRGELIAEIVFTFLALIIFTFYFDRIGIYNNINGQWMFTPVLTAAFTPYIVWFGLLWVLTIIQDAILLRKGSWQTGSRVFSIVLSGFTIILAASLMTNIQSLYSLQGTLGLPGLETTLQSLLNAVLFFALVIVIIANAVKIVQMIWRLVSRRVSR
jgi:hypothetical protein